MDFIVGCSNRLADGSAMGPGACVGEAEGEGVGVGVRVEEGGSIGVAVGVG